MGLFALLRFCLLNLINAKQLPFSVPKGGAVEVPTQEPGLDGIGFA